MVTTGQETRPPVCRLRPWPFLMSRGPGRGLITSVISRKLLADTGGWPESTSGDRAQGHASGVSRRHRPCSQARGVPQPHSATDHTAPSVQRQASRGWHRTPRPEDSLGPREVELPPPQWATGAQWQNRSPSLKGSASW